MLRATEIADAGDRQAAEQMEIYCDRLARALSVVINIIDPHAVVLGGGLCKMKRLYARVPELWKQYVFSEPELIATKLLPPRFGDQKHNDSIHHPRGRGARFPPCLPLD